MTYTADPGMSIGHTHLKVSDLDRAIAFYRDVIGLDVMQHYGDQAAFLSAGGYHHHIGLNTWESRGGTPPPKGHTGLYHVAFLYPDRAALGRALANVVDHGVKLTGAADHGVSEAVYFDDPDGNGIEMYRDRAPEDWPRDAQGNLEMFNARLDVQALIDEGRASL
jgi:catechol 2,3-dioxygenase